jgi:hypothetical protein
VHVVVVEAGQQRAAGGVDDDVGVSPGRVTDRGDDAVGAVDVDQAAVDLGAPDQQRRRVQRQASTGTSAIAAAISASGSS